MAVEDNPKLNKNGVYKIKKQNTSNDLQDCIGWLNKSGNIHNLQ